MPVHSGHRITSTLHGGPHSGQLHQRAQRICRHRLTVTGPVFQDRISDQPALSNTIMMQEMNTQRR